MTMPEAIFVRNKGLQEFGDEVMKGSWLQVA